MSMLTMVIMGYMLAAQLRSHYSSSSSSLSLSLRAMMEIFMTTQTTHEQLLDGLITEVAALRVDFLEYRSAFSPPPPSDS